MSVEFINFSNSSEDIDEHDFSFTSCSNDNNVFVSEGVPDSNNPSTSDFGVLIVSVGNDLNGDSYASDYRDGISTIDKVKMSRHISGTTPFESYPQSSDAPFNYVSADIDKDHDVDADDVELMRQIILHIIDPGVSERDSWEWFRDKSIQDAVDFDTNPYYYALSEGNGALNSNPMAYTYVPISDINSNPFYYYGIRTTKVGDINNSNSQNCLGSYQLQSHDDNIEIDNHLFKKGDKINVTITIKSDDILEAFQLPLTIDQEKFEIIDINSPLTILNFDSNRIGNEEYLCIASQGNYNKNNFLKDYSFDILLQLKEDVYLNDHSFTSKKFKNQVELISEGEYTKGNISVSINKLTNLGLKYSSNYLHISGIDPRTETLEITYFSTDGRLIKSETVKTIKNDSLIHLVPLLNSALNSYVISVTSLYQEKSLKIIK